MNFDATAIARDKFDGPGCSLDKVRRSNICLFFNDHKPFGLCINNYDVDSS
jgi:hypothetical protein